MVQVHSIKDLAGEDDAAQDKIPAAAREMPVDGEQLPTEFHGLYHEKQIGALCAVHALNNLVQRRQFDEVELASLAHELDAAEAAALEGSRLSGEEGSGNVRADGFFSVQVIVTALQRAGLSCAPARLQVPEREQGFILNRREHWFALRRLGSDWFDLNSMFPHPKHMSPTHLALFFQAHIDMGYSIFVVRGAYPRAALAAAVDACAEPPDAAAPPDADRFAAFSGTGQRLSAPDEPQIDPSLQAAALDDPDLAAAIAASIADNPPRRRDAKEDAAEIRRKRLARFG